MTVGIPRRTVYVGEENDYPVGRDQEEEGETNEKQSLKKTPRGSRYDGTM